MIDSAGGKNLIQQTGIPDYIANYRPQMSKDPSNSRKFKLKTDISVCQSNITMCDGKNNYNWDDANLDDAANAVVAAGIALLLVYIFIPVCIVICICVCCCKCNKVCCFAEEAPVPDIVVEQPKQ